MHLSFSDKEIRKIFEDEKFAEKILGTDLARKLKTRIADIMAAKCAAEIPVGSPTEVVIDNKPGMKVTILSPHYLDFCSVHQHAPLNTAGKMDWSQVTRVKILHLV